jgi:hypothetical protein
MEAWRACQFASLIAMGLCGCAKTVVNVTAVERHITAVERQAVGKEWEDFDLPNSEV